MFNKKVFGVLDCVCYIDKSNIFFIFRFYMLVSLGGNFEEDKYKVSNTTKHGSGTVIAFDYYFYILKLFYLNTKATKLFIIVYFSNYSHTVYNFHQCT